jgi:hypothetical protein
MMGISAKPKISVLTPEKLLGPLNDVEKKYAPLKLFASGPMENPGSKAEAGHHRVAKSV